MADAPQRDVTFHEGSKPWLHRGQENSPGLEQEVTIAFDHHFTR